MTKTTTPGIGKLAELIEEFEASEVENPDDSLVLTDEDADLDEASTVRVQEIVAKAEEVLVDHDGEENQVAIQELRKLGFDASTGVITTEHGDIHYNEPK